MSTPTDLTSTIEYARKIHGHVGPFLVIGLRMGIAAKQALGISDSEQTQLRAQVTVPLNLPFSCLLDGVQVSTTCTIGNQRLQFENVKTIQATFQSEKTSKKVKITLKQRFWEQLEQKRTQDRLDEEFAWELSKLPESQLFEITIE
jgi:formylmethanofuran dehydrogenase subunit E